MEERLKQKRGKSLDMTTGSPMKLILQYSIPLLFGNVLQQFYNMVDSYVVGNFAENGDLALAAVGNGGPITFLVAALFIGLSGGVTVLIAQLFGAGDMQSIRKAANTVYSLVIPVGLGIAAFFVLLLPALLKLLALPEEIYRSTYLYTVICLGGLIGPLGYNFNTGIMQGLGDTQTPLILLCCSTVLNIILDLLFVIVFDMSTAGVALATILAQFFSWIAGILLINKRYSHLLHISPFRFQITGPLLKEILRIGIPSAIQMISVSLGNIVMQRVVNSNGAYFAAGATCAIRIDAFAILPSMTFSNAITTYVGQNLGAGRLDRIKKGIQATLICGLFVTAVVSVLSYIFAADLVGIFNSNPAVIKAGADYLHIIMPYFWMLTVMFIYSGILRGLGKVLVTMIAMISGQAILRVTAGIILNKLFGGAAIYYSYVFGWVAGAGIVMSYYYFGKWKTNIKRFYARQPEQPTQEPIISE